MDAPEFDGLVAEALDSLPPEIQDMMNNVQVVVEVEPTADQLQALGPRGGTLLGLYQGVPLTERGNYDRMLPDKITIFQGPITRMIRSAEGIRSQVRKTVIHEIAHHFGIEESRIHELGWG
jgi:predicted Zn-dependent protease with MMP-like domain